MVLYGIYGEHELDDCPLINEDSRRIILQVNEIIKEVKHIKFIGMFHSPLEHTFLWVVDCADAHTIQKFLIDSKISVYHRAKIVPISTFNDLVNLCKSIEAKSNPQ